ncbi:hypothetical protein EV643_12515 [Kribbella sp. VKM Ac-2527]|uniref:Uncharacterized protein n=1 Tax=Kribbella caucasensis TaxID=2512215 RepID=A0A4V3C6R7_9ACTN|nr:DUF6158 family protein [Kribbella sp. VKM Ac-2527]TDO34758.1 hypothetical protein EV643_12515 [Kribbella sp. VKM Ac-2527]
MTTPDHLGRPAAELTDAELEQQGTNAHATRNWVFLHGTAEQFATHTARMLELEQEYLRRYPKRTWQGSGAADGSPSYDDPAAELLRRLAAAPGGRLHKLEVHQLAREVGLDRATLAKLYTADPPLLTTEQQDRVVTDAGQEWLATH